ncbi:hypothetical protein BD289DRAFT_32699 [Coniella lustricola]|uniref:Uncharacterized protein n=1 Tax=Coniella lustricola TaxID=2025994 RepID=A0A2T3A2M1_9PEZI|nr:hypothetical protein BD289DRAFT_32699 [Coniella lustricola]
MATRVKLRGALGTALQRLWVRQHKTVFVTGLLCLIVLTVPAIIPVPHTVQASRWIKNDALHARTAACDADMPQGYGPRVTEPFSDDAQGFLNFPLFAELAGASTAVAGYKLAAKNKETTVGKKAVIHSLGQNNIDTYNPQICATQCDNLPGCVAFNIYFQRSPRVAPSSTSNGACPSPEPMTNIFCSYYSTKLTARDLIRYGEMRGQFQIVVAGSNLYNKIDEQAFEWLPRSTMPLTLEAQEVAPMNEGENISK